ncbi:MAG: ABC transporter permease subunit [Clostridiales bacterium]|nr:ABC transporter permease subunit [Clostridiales bacterium]
MIPSISPGRKFLRVVSALLFWGLVWQLASFGVGNELVLPQPLSVVRRLAELMITWPFWLSAGQSLLNVFAGFIVGVSAGTLLAFLTAFVGAAEILLAPAIRVVRATPVASFIILALLWLGKARVPAFSAALMVTPVVWQAVFAALRDTDKNLLEMARIFGFGRLKTLKLIYIPSIRTQWSAACATSMGLAWKSGVAAEVICQVRPTIGEALFSAKIYLETPDLFAWTAVVICLSMLLENVLARLFVGKRGRRQG